MNITSIIRKNILMLVALATVVGFSAFKAVDSVITVQTNNWHEVDDNGDLNSSGQTTPPGDCPSNGDEFCALQITLSPGITNFPETVSEALTMEAASQLTISGRRYKE